MATRQHRISEFNSGPPPIDTALQILCEDHNGTYVPPFQCRFIEGEWFSLPGNTRIDATVLGWRPRL